MRRLKQIAAAVLVLCFSGALFEQIGHYRDRRRFQQIGRSVSIGGRTLNIFCSGQGAPVVVFDTYGHQSGYAWSSVQREVAKHTRACWYDRAGYGWSESGPLPRTFQAIASDLHNLLREARVDPPFILVGAGDSASHIRVYYGSYPDEVAGIVFVNANDLDDPSVKIPDSAKGGFARTFGSSAVRARRIACWLRPSLNRLGLTRFASFFGKPRDTISLDLTAEQQIQLNDLSDNATAQEAGEACAREESMQQVRAAGNLKDVPLVVLASGAGEMIAASDNRGEAAWKKYRTDQVPRALSGLSTRGRVVLIDGELTKNAMVRAILDVCYLASRSSR
jgi:pimeloyl-ACP methyl ester carboxylesterase